MVPSATATVEEVLPAAGCFDQRSSPPPPFAEGWRNPFWAGGRLRAKVFPELPVADTGQVCAHLVVVNLQTDAATVFRARLGGPAFSQSSFVNMTAVRMFAQGATMSVSDDGVVSDDWIGPGATNIYRLGNCTPPAPRLTNLATPPINYVILPNTVSVATPGVNWGGPENWGGVSSGGQTISATTDTAVALAPFRHSLRLNLVNGRAVTIPLPGRQLVKPSTSVWCDPAWHCKQAEPGQRVVGASATLPAGKAFHVSLQVQASPCGTTVELMDGDWIVSSSTEREGNQVITVSKQSANDTI